MSKLVILVIIGFCVWIISILLIKNKTQKLPSISDGLFLKKFKAKYHDVPDEMILHERRNIAKQLGVLYEKLDVDMNFDELSNYLNILGCYDLAVGDLEDDISELFEQRKIDKPYIKPSTIGELIYGIIKAKLH